MRSNAALIIFPVLAALLLGLPCFAHADTGNDDPRVKAAFDRGWALMNIMHKDLKNLDLAAAQYREVLSIYPDNSDAMWKLSEVIFKKGEALEDKKRKKELFDLSLSWAEKSLALSPQKAEPHYWVAVNCAMKADMAGALKALNLVNRTKSELAKVIEMDPKNRFATLAKAVLAAIYLESPWPLRDLAKAEELARQSASEDPNLTWASVTLGRTLARRGKKDLARKELSRCLATARPTYVWDSVLYDWPDARKALAGLK